MVCADDFNPGIVIFVFPRICHSVDIEAGVCSNSVEPLTSGTKSVCRTGVEYVVYRYGLAHVCEQASSLSQPSGPSRH